jgi:hypothetical protein
MRSHSSWQGATPWTCRSAEHTLTAAKREECSPRRALTPVDGVEILLGHPCSEFFDTPGIHPSAS